MIMYVLWFQIIVHMSFEVLAGASIENLTTNNTFTNCMTFNYFAYIATEQKTSSREIRKVSRKNTQTKTRF